MNVYVCEHKDEKFNKTDFFVSKSREAGIGWLREKAKASSGDALQAISHVHVAGNGSALAINAMNLMATAAEISCEIDSLIYDLKGITVLSESNRSVSGGKVQNWRNCEVAKT